METILLYYTGAIHLQIMNVRYHVGTETAETTLNPKKKPCDKVFKMAGGKERKEKNPLYQIPWKTMVSVTARICAFLRENVVMLNINLKTFFFLFRALYMKFIDKCKVLMALLRTFTYIC